MSASVPPAVTVAALGRVRTLATLQALAGGLQPGEAGAARLLERIAASEDAEVLRAGLMEYGALAIIEAQPR